MATGTPPSARRQTRLQLLGAATGACLLAVAVLLVAWVGDDALITFRTIENWLSGHGLRWNVDQRVQTYTHPLWLLLLTPVRILVGNCYAASLLLGGLGTLVAATLLARLASLRAAGAVLVVMALSRFFVDYATSGLETGLTYALLATLAWLSLRPPPDRPRSGAIALVCGLLLTNRLDMAPLVLPFLLQLLYARGFWRGVRVGVLGLSPLWCWLAFAAVYYGTVLPVTAYAKVGHGLGASTMALQGLGYAAYLVLEDPVTATAVVVGLLLGAFGRRPGQRTLAAAIALHVVYVVAVGGDFMAGRFFLPAYVLAIALCADAMSRCPHRVLPAVVAVALVLASLPGVPTCFFGHREPAKVEVRDAPWGVWDERSYYYTATGLLSPARNWAEPGVASALLRSRGDERPRIHVVTVAGLYGYAGGDLMHIVDRFLCDPLLARLPAVRGRPWRIGHFPRRLPDGYLESLAPGTNRIRHPALARYFAAIRTITEEPVLATGRLGVLWDHWLGRHDADLRAYVDEAYHEPRPLALDVADLAARIEPGTLWSQSPTAVAIGPAGAVLHVTDAMAPEALELLVDGGDTYVFEFCAADEVIAERSCASPSPAFEGMAGIRVAAPSRPFDRVRLRVDFGADGVAAIGGLRVR